MSRARPNGEIDDDDVRNDVPLLRHAGFTRVDAAAGGRPCGFGADVHTDRRSRRIDGWTAHDASERRVGDPMIAGAALGVIVFVAGTMAVSIVFLCVVTLAEMFNTIVDWWRYR